MKGKILLSVDTGPEDRLYLYTLDYLVTKVHKWVQSIQEENIGFLSNEQKIQMFGYNNPLITYQNKKPHYMMESYAAALTHRNTANKETHEYMMKRFSKPPPSQKPNF